METNSKLSNEYEQLGKIVKMSGELETFLTDNYGAKGKGLNEKVNDVEEELKKYNIEIYKLRTLVGIRNKSVHEASFEIEDVFAKYVLTFDDILNQLITGKREKDRREKEKIEFEQREKERKEKELIEFIQREKERREKEKIEFDERNRILNEEIEKEKKKNLISIIVKISIAIIFISFFYYFYSKDKEIKMKSIQKNINEISIQIEIEKNKLQDLIKNLNKEQDKQGKIRTLFFDNETVNRIENDIKTVEDNLDIYNNKLKENKEKL